MSSTWETWNHTWLTPFSQIASELMADADAGHGIDHVQRVVTNATQLGMAESADPAIVLPAVWLHDCILVPKNSPQRSMASRLAANHAIVVMEKLGYPRETFPRIHHCIEAHSFSASVACESREACIVQDADRLEALGAIGIARCLMTGGALRQRLYFAAEPFPQSRPADDTQQSIDHFFLKLFKLPATMKTAAGQQLARQRTRIMVEFLRNLADELGEPRAALEEALQRHAIKTDALGMVTPA